MVWLHHISDKVFDGFWQDPWRGSFSSYQPKEGFFKRATGKTGQVFICFFGYGSLWFFGLVTVEMWYLKVR